MIAGWFRGGVNGRPYRHLRPGGYYRVERGFRDHDGRMHPRGQRWRYRTYDFLPHEAGLSLFFLTDHGEELQIRLQDHTDAEGPTIAALKEVLVRCEPARRSAFAALKSIEGDWLVSFNGIDLIAFRWRDITKVSVAQGRQLYDASLCLTIDHRRGTAIFLPDFEPIWQPFLDGLETTLAQTVPRGEWMKTLAEDPTATVRIFRRPPFWQFRP